MFNLGIYGNHNAAIAISKDKTILEVVEIERLVDKKNASLFYWGIDAAVFGHPTHPNIKELLIEIQRYFLQKYNAEKYSTVAFNQIPYHDIWYNDWKGIFDADRYEYVPHHVSHSCCGLYQSNFQRSLIISMDGWSDERFFHIYLAEKGKELIHLHEGTVNYAVAYAIPAHYIADIKQEDYGTGNLVYSGKIMGLAGYGNVNKSLAKTLIEFYKKANTWDFNYNHNNFVQMFTYLGVGHDKRITGQAAWDLAATNQYVFEKLLLEELTPFINQYDLPLILVGGAAMNVTNNTALAKIRDVFVPPNPSDCGQAVGVLCSIIKPQQPVDCTYIGSEVRDRNDLLRMVFEKNGNPIDLNNLADDIVAGKIYGVVRERSEHGPRALGNRSIICNPSIPDMKDILNAKVKGREYYRPFAPVVRLEDVNEYFDWDKESRWMSFCPNVREEYKEKLLAITHVDGTARVQTVTKEQNEFLYNLLTLMKDKTGIGVLLNTSFNIAGKPILNTYKDAVWVLENKELDGLILENFIIKK